MLAFHKVMRKAPMHIKLGDNGFKRRYLKLSNSQTVSRQKESKFTIVLLIQSNAVNSMIYKLHHRCYGAAKCSEALYLGLLND